MSSKCVITNSMDARRFAIISTKLYVPVVALSIQDNAKLLEHLKASFERTIGWNKYLSKVESYNTRKPYLDKLIDPSFQWVNRLFVLSFENDTDRTLHTKYYLPKVEIKDYNVEIDVKNFFGQLINNNIKTYENIRKIAADQGDDYTTGFLLDYPYFKTKYKMIAMNLSKQQALDADPKAIQQINFTKDLDRAERPFMFLILGEAKETILDFSQRTARIL